MQENDETEFHENDETSEDVLDEKFEPSHLREAIEGHDREKLTKIFDLIPDADIAEAAEELSIAQLLSLFREVPSSKTAPVFDELSQSKKEELVNALKDKDLVSLIARNRTTWPIRLGTCRPTWPRKSSMPPRRKCGRTSTASSSSRKARPGPS